MANKKNGFDDIFKATSKPGKGKKAPAKKKAAAKQKAAPKVAAAPAADNGLTVDPALVLHNAWQTHENEILYRKEKEDKLLFFAVGALVILVFGAAYVMANAGDWFRFSRFVFRLFFAGIAFGAAFAGGALIELNRKRMQDLLSMVVKIQEKLGLYDEAGIPGNDGAFFPNTYKFIGSINDDETNYSQMILKVAGAAAIFVILLLT